MPWRIDIKFFDDGSGEKEGQNLKEAVLKAGTEIKNFTLKYELFPINRGKGAVLRDGFKQGIAEYQYVGFLDGDGATPFYEMIRIMEKLVNETGAVADAMIGSRVKCLGKTVQRSLKRHLSGRIFATLLSNIFSIPVYDSQCGAKLFSTSILSVSLLDHCYDQRWLFDTQLLILIYRKKFRVLETPVDWKDIPGSKVSLFRDSWRMFWGLLAFRSYLKKAGL